MALQGAERVVEATRRRMFVDARLENRGENAYGTTLSISYSPNLCFSSLVLKVSVLHTNTLHLLSVLHTNTLHLLSVLHTNTLRLLSVLSRYRVPQTSRSTVPVYLIKATGESATSAPPT